MIFCPKCGSQVSNTNEFCPNCGNRIQYLQRPGYRQQESNGLAIAGFILAFFFPLVGLILSIIGYSKAKEMNNSGKGLALAGIILSSIFMGLVLIIWIIKILIII